MIRGVKAEYFCNLFQGSLVLLKLNKFIGLPKVLGDQRNLFFQGEVLSDGTCLSDRVGPFLHGMDAVQH